MAAKEDTRIFVGGLSWDTTERRLEDAFSRYGKVIEAQIMLERNTGRPRGFGFVTFTDRRAVEDAIHEMHGRDFDGRVISVNKAEPKVGSDDYGYGGGGYSNDRVGGYGRGGPDRAPPVGQSDCFKCGRPGHWARECPSADGGRFSSRSRFNDGTGGGGGRGYRFGGSDRYADRFGGPDRYADRIGGSDRYADRIVDRYEDRDIDDRYDAGRYGDRDLFDSRDIRYSSGRDHYVSDRLHTGKRPAGERYGSDRYSQNGFAKDGGYDREGGPRGGDRYTSGGPARQEGGYRERTGPYDRPSRGKRPSYDRI